MILVIGGAYQGKLNFSKEMSGIEDGWIDGSNCSYSDIFSCKGIDQFHVYVRRFMIDNQNILNGNDNDPLFYERSAKDFAFQLKKQNRNIIVIADEIGNGIIPTNEVENLWREASGRFCTEIAAQSEEVYRVFCGIGTRIK